jgi:hypothetical protein
MSSNFSSEATNFSSLISEKSSCFAEVIESSLETFTAQSWEWDFFPNFGSLVYVQDQEYLTLGCVIHIQTGSMDPMRYPFPYQKTEAELIAEQPQIFEFLKTIFKVQILGSVKKNTLNQKVLYMLPPKPCKIHAFVGTSPLPIQSLFFENPDFLHILFAFAHNVQNLDELLLAILRQQADQKILTQHKLEQFLHTFSLLTGNDYRRLKLFTQRIEHIL